MQLIGAAACHCACRTQKEDLKVGKAKMVADDVCTDPLHQPKTSADGGAFF